MNGANEFALHNETVYVIPMHKCDNPVKMFGEENLKALATILNDDRILKVGFALGNDIPLIKTVLTDLEINMSGWVDLQKFWQVNATKVFPSMRDNFPDFQYPHDDEEGCTTEDRKMSASLQYLIYLLLNVDMSKELTTSNWAKRPLSDLSRATVGTLPTHFYRTKN